MDGEVSIRGRKNALRFFAVLLILFLVLSTRFFPRASWTEYGFAALGVALFAAYLLAARVIARAEKKKVIRALLLLVAFVNAAALSLLVVHAVKLDAARAELPANGAVRLLFSYDTEVYSSADGFIEDMNADLTVGETRVKDGGAAMVDLDGTTDIRCAVSFQLGGKAYAGEKSIKVRISPRRLKNGYRASMEIPCGVDVSCDVTITASYEPTFWEILLN
jgi:signal transduction histidine kinase